MKGVAHLLDMDGVLVRGGQPIPGAVDFVRRLVEEKVPFQILTNNSRFTPQDHADRLEALGFPVDKDCFYTSALSTARFIGMQHKGASAYVIGEHGLTEALQSVGCRITQFSPDYVVLGEAMSFHYEQIVLGARLILKGARFIGTNPDVNGPSEHGLHPACGAIAALIEAATGKKPYFLGKPNPFMMRGVLAKLNVRAADAVMVGDRMDTDVLAGLESGLRTVLVLSGVTQREDLERFPFRPDHVVESVVDLIPGLSEEAPKAREEAPEAREKETRQKTGG